VTEIASVLSVMEFARDAAYRCPHRTILVAAFLLCMGCDKDCDDLGDGAKICGEKTAFLILDDPYPVVKAELNGKQVNLLLDTGVGYYEDSNAFGYISATLLGVAEGGTRVESLCLGKMCLKEIPIYAMDTPFSNAEPGAINGTVGMGMLHFFNVEFDKMETVTLWLPTGKKNDNDCGSSTYSITYAEDGVPLGNATADTLELGDILLDTGAYYTLLNQTTIDSMGDYVWEGAIEEGGCSFDGCVDDGKFVSALKRYCVFQECVEGLEIKFPVWNVVGSSFFKHFRAVFLFESEELILCRD
jgi:hypothetical protein